MSLSRPKGITIRNAIAEDAEAVHAGIVALAETLPGDTVVRTTAADFRRQFSAQPALVHGLVAERNGDPVGLCLWLTYFSSWRGSGIYIQDLYVAPGERGSGLGRLLIARAAADGAKAGGRFIRLAVDIANARAVPFYERFGFTETIEDRMFMLAGDGFDRLVADGGSSNSTSETPE